jgi:hypothetical protein
MTTAINASCSARTGESDGRADRSRTLQSCRRFTERCRRHGQSCIQSIEYYEDDRRSKPYIFSIGEQRSPPGERCFCLQL